MTITETERLSIRQVERSDAAFILELLNDQGWLRYIGDRNVHSLEDAERYIEHGPQAMYKAKGFGLYLVELKESGEAVGLCGLLKRDFLEDVDIGYAFLERHRGAGYASEAAAAMLGYARDSLGLKRIAAITTVDNERSMHLLEKLGLKFARLVSYPGESEQLNLFVIDL